jgi:hypothetical protein
MPLQIHQSATCTFSYRVMHVAQHEVQQEGLALAEGPGHRHHHHVEVLHVVLQQDVLQSRLVQLKAVLLFIGQDDLDGPGRFLRCNLLEKMRGLLSYVLDVKLFCRPQRTWLHFTFSSS